jgi:hypothetical protein
MYKLNRRDKKKLALGRLVVIGLSIVGLIVVVWFAWIRPIQHSTSIDSFEKCRDAGNAIQESYPEVCLTKEGKRFVNPRQAAAHDASLNGATDPVMPADPSLLYLDIKEWGIRVPLTSDTFDLTYTYLQDGLNDRLRFSYKRLINASICPGDIGLTVTRMVNKHEPPYSPDNPPALAQVGTYYYYPAYAGSPCYDPENPDHMALVKKITGDQSLVQITAALFGKLEALPK